MWPSKCSTLPISNGSRAARLQKEAHILARLDHPGIVPVHDAGTLPDGRTFYVMKLIQGKRLDAVSASDIPLPDRLNAFGRVLDAVAFAHAHGVVHRDLKPENVMVGSFGEVLRDGLGRGARQPSRRRDRGGRDTGLHAAGAGSSRAIASMPGPTSSRWARCWRTLPVPPRRPR